MASDYTDTGRDYWIIVPWWAEEYICADAGVIDWFRTDGFKFDTSGKRHRFAAAHLWYVICGADGRVLTIAADEGEP